MEGHELAYLLKMVQQVNNKGDANWAKETSEEYIGIGEDHAISFDIKEVVDLAVEGVLFNSREKSQNGKCSLPVFTGSYAYDV